MRAKYRYTITIEKEFANLREGAVFEETLESLIPQINQILNTSARWDVSERRDRKKAIPMSSVSIVGGISQ